MVPAWRGRDTDQRDDTLDDMQGMVDKANETRHERANPSTDPIRTPDGMITDPVTGQSWLGPGMKL
jgi:hypothetical protein